MNRTFHPSPPTVGVELEWQLVDRETLDLRDGILPLLDLLHDDPSIKPELIQTSVETITLPAASTAELRPQLVETVTRLSDAAAREGMAIVGAGTHPFCERPSSVTPLPRYLEMDRQQGYLARAQIVYALQVHVGMPSGDAAVRVLRAATPFLPVLLALSASSPFIRGYETPFASYRQRVLAAARTTGPPPRLDDWRAFLGFLDVADRVAMFSSYRDIHWDLRVRPDYGTVEVRVMDAQPTIDRSLALAALVHSLLVALLSGKGAARLSRILGPLPAWLERENAYRASHDALDALLVSDASGAAAPLRRVLRDLFDVLAPIARALGEEDDLARARELAEHPAYLEQRALFRRTASTSDIVRALAGELLAEIERPALAA